MKKKLLRMSLLSVFALLFGGAAFGALMSEGESEGGNDTSAEEDITAKWDFTSSADPRATAFYQGNSGTVASNVADINLTVNATSGKFDSTNRTGDVQINSGTIIKVPVRHAGDKVAIVGNYAVNYTIGTEEGVTDLNKTYEATTADATAKFVTITATGQTYFYSITVQQFASSDDTAGEDSEETAATDMTATWDYSNTGVMEETMALSSSATTGTVKAVEDNGILLTVEANGATFRNNGNNIQVRQGAVFKVPVKNTGDLVTIKGYPGYSYYKINDGDEITNTNDNPTTEYKAKSSDVANGYVAITSTNDNNYFYSISVTQYAPKAQNIQEKSIYKTNFSDWEALTAATSESVVKKTTKYTEENLDFTFYNTGVNTGTYDETKFTQNDGNRIYCPKDANAYIITSALGDITKVRFVHGATGGNRGYKLEAKGDGDADWVTISDSYANPASWCEVTANVNKKNCQLRFTNLSESNYAYIFELEIFGNVDLSGAPLLGSFKANGTEYAADDIFEMGNSGNYEATIELFSTDNMISADNPIAEVTPDNGEVGTITYKGDADQCEVTIPVTAEGKTVNYVISFIRKPSLTMTYYANGEAIGTQKIEKDTKIGAFGQDITAVKATKEGYKARGWFKQNSLGEKYTTESIISEDVSLYAVETEEEIPSTSRKYTFDLTSKTFYAEDHEAFSPQADAKCKWHDTTHGWAAYNGDKIDLLVGPKAIISIAVCKYGKGTNILVKKGDETLETLVGMDAESDGKVVSYPYEGEAGTLTLEMVASGEMYIHNVSVSNIAETNYTMEGQWIYVKKGDVSSFRDALEIANGQGGTDRIYIYVPNGTYDLGEAVQTPISRDNLSIIGESMEGTIIKNAPPVSKEGLQSASLLRNSSNGLYMQDLTLQNDLDYYGAGAAGRANAFHDAGKNTICKNVKLMSYQDTYLSNTDQKFYWETSEIHGAVDYICGGSDVFFESCKLVNESRKKDEKSGEATITAHQPRTGEKFGYVFNNCTIENKAATFNFGRAWGGASGATSRPMTTYLNTTLNQPKEIISTRFIVKGMNSQSGVFHEYNSKDANGTVVSPASNKQTFTDKDGGDAQTYETILTDAEAANYTIAKVLDDWATEAQAATKQLEAPEATLKDGTITWSAVDGAAGYAIFKNDELLAVVGGDVISYIIESTEAAAARRAGETEPVYTIRVANQRGGFGEPRTISIVTGIQGITANEVDGQVVYDLQGHRVEKATKGVFIINGKKVIMK